MIKVELKHMPENTLALIDDFASVCYDSTPKNEGVIALDCMDSEHWQAAECNRFVFHISGISRACSHQIVRHRTSVICQRSQRYVSEGGFEYVIPDSIKKNPKTLDEYENLMNTIDDVYLYLTKCGVPKEDARFVLPNACETELNIAIDLHNFIHFENLRLCNRAQWEIRKVAELMRDAVIKEEPRLKKYIVPKCEMHEVPYCTEKRSCKMHEKLNDIVKDEYRKIKAVENL